MSITFNIYILELQTGKYFVGKTTKPVKERYLEHVDGIGDEWTALYQPVKLIEQFSTNDVYDEDKITKKYMGLYGIENVRGGSYSNITLADWQIKSLTHELKGLSDFCYKCGKSGHFSSDCVFDLYSDYLTQFNNLENIQDEINQLEKDLGLEKMLFQNIQTTKYLFDYKQYIDYKKQNLDYQKECFITNNSLFSIDIKSGGYCYINKDIWKKK